MVASIKKWHKLNNVTHIILYANQIKENNISLGVEWYKF